MPRIAYTQPQVGPQGFSRTSKVLGDLLIPITTADNVTGNTLALFKAPAGFTVTGVYLIASDIDTGTAVSVTLGDATDDDRFVTASTIGQAGGSTSTLAATGLYYQFPADTDVLLKFGTQSTTPVAGTVGCYMTGFMRNP